MYCEEAIRDRIVKEDIAFYKSKQDIPKVSRGSAELKDTAGQACQDFRKSIMRSCTGWENSKKTHTVRYGSTGGYP